MSGLCAHVRVRRPDFDLDLDLRAAAGEVVALIGPNGAGKTTALRALAGLVPGYQGRTVMDGDTWDDPQSGVSVPTEHRRVGMVFQDYLLFPHLSAVQNVAFGLRARGMDRRRARGQALDWLRRVDLSSHADARPAALSGGQAQRVALARALATRPRLLLLDEPLAALDAATRVHVRSDLRRHLADFDGVTVLVTHDPLDAMVLGDRLVVVEAGRVVQDGTPSEVARAPRTQYVARLVGLNLLRGRASGLAVDLSAGGRLSVADTLPARDGDEVLLAFPPSAVSLHAHHPDGSARNVWAGAVAGLERHGHVVRVRLDATPPVLADVTTAAVADLDLVPGTPVWASLKATEIHAYPA